MALAVGQKVRFKTVTGKVVRGHVSYVGMDSAWANIVSDKDGKEHKLIPESIIAVRRGA